MLREGISWIMVTTVPGLEDIVLREAHERLDVLEADLRFCNVSGRVSLKIPESHVNRVLAFRSIEHIIRLIKVFDAGRDKSGLSQIYSGVYDCDFPLGSTFRVTCERVGEHDFTSIDVQRVAGQAIVDKYGRKVDLKNPETIVRVDVAYNKCIVGIQMTKTSLRIRYPRIFQHHSALNPVIAYAMLRIADVKPGDKILDAFCGGGTIVIEAAQICREIEPIGVDISPKSIEGAWRNAEAAGVKDKVRFIVGDSRGLERVLPAGWMVDKVISNLPFGIRSGRLEIIPKMYAEFLSSLKRLLHDNSRVCLLTVHRELLESLGANLGYEVLESRQIMHGGLRSWIILLKLA